MNSEELKSKYSYVISNLENVYTIANIFLKELDNKLQEKNLTEEEFILLDKNFFLIADITKSIGNFIKTSKRIKFDVENFKNLKDETIAFFPTKKENDDIFCWAKAQPIITVS